MSIPNSILGSKFPFGVTAAADMYTSRATLRPVTQVTDTTGQVTNAFADSTNPALMDLPCRKSPLIIIRPQDQETDTDGFQRYNAKFQVSFLHFINVPVEVLATWQVKIDGSIYQIFSDESDGSGLTTRLLVSDALPYGY